MKHLTLIDGNSIMFRAYYATAYPGATLMQTTSGTYTNAVFAFANMLEKIRDLSNSHILVAFDTAEPTKRHLAYEEYKAGRKEMPEELAQQIPLIHQLLDYYGIKHYSKGGYEADDIIGTMAKQAAANNINVDIYSSDRDLLQLVDQNITVRLLKSGMKEVHVYTPEGIINEYGLTHHQMIDLKALMGDKSDNIPGIPSVGEKTAIKLLKEYQTLENVIENAAKINGKLGENIRNNIELAKLSKQLVTIDTNATIDVSLEDTKTKPILENELLTFYKTLELKTLVLSYLKKQKNNQDQTLFDNNELQKNEETNNGSLDFKYHVLETTKDLEKILNQNLALFFEFSDRNYHKADLWGIGVSNGKDNYFVDPNLLFESPAFLAYLSDLKYEKYLYDYKSIDVYLRWHNHQLNGCSYDLLLAAYILKSSIGKEDFTTIAQLFSVFDLAYDEEIYGKGVKKALPLLIDDYQSHIAKKAATIFNLKDKTLAELKTKSQLHLLTEIEIPLSKCLADMEFEGLLVDMVELDGQTKNLNDRIASLEEQIFTAANTTFNISSPKQLGDVLFEQLGLPNGRKTKTGYSTDVEVLNAIKDFHPVVPLVLQYRQLTKLYSTYLVGIKQALFSDNKVHTIFNQALTLTGRLSSLEPNLQNIPIRTEEGRQVRKIFIPREDHVFLGADYSQIELRILAEIADVVGLKNAFKNKEDIHTATAKEVFHVDTVDSEQRRRAKAVNFGIIYGIGPWSLAEDINVTVKEAEMFIKRYFDVYPEIKKYMEDIVVFAKEYGYVETLLKRRRYIPELESKVYAQREFGKRTALNAPIQGSAADIIKIAMIKLYHYLKDNNKKSKLILQVHDELILEVPLDELTEMKKVVPEIMKTAYPLDVELETSCDVGNDWYQLK